VTRLALTAGPLSSPPYPYSVGNRRSNDDRLLLFVDVLTAALSRRAVRNGLRASWEVEWDDEAGDVRFFSNRGDEEDLRSLMLDIRKFVAEKEDVQLSKVLNILWLKSSGNERLRGQVEQVRRDWTQAQKDTTYPHGEDESPQELTPIRSWKMWVNGGLFHDDEDLRYEYAALSEPDRARVDMLAVRLVMSLLGLTVRTRSIIWEFLPPPGYLDPTPR